MAPRIPSRRPILVQARLADAPKGSEAGSPALLSEDRLDTFWVHCNPLWALTCRTQMESDLAFT